MNLAKSAELTLMRLTSARDQAASYRLELQEVEEAAAAERRLAARQAADQVGDQLSRARKRITSLEEELAALKVTCSSAPSSWFPDTAL